MTPAAEYVNPKTLVPWTRNPRKNDHIVDGVARSIQRYGFGAPIVARLEDRMVIAGHTRLKAAEALGIDVVPVRFMDIPRKEAERLALEDNHWAELSEWDTDALKDLACDIDLGEIGWSDVELGELSMATDLDTGISDDVDLGDDYDYDPGKSSVRFMVAVPSDREQDFRAAFRDHLSATGATMRPVK